MSSQHRQPYSTYLAQAVMQWCQCYICCIPWGKFWFVEASLGGNPTAAVGQLGLAPVILPAQVHVDQ